MFDIVCASGLSFIVLLCEFGKVNKCVWAVVAGMALVILLSLLQI